MGKPRAMTSSASQGAIPFGQVMMIVCFSVHGFIELVVI
jgi:hypothetical protein